MLFLWFDVCVPAGGEGPTGRERLWANLQNHPQRSQPLWGEDGERRDEVTLNQMMQKLNVVFIPQQKERVKDFKTIIIKYLESLVQTQQQVNMTVLINAWFSISGSFLSSSNWCFCLRRIYIWNKTHFNLIICRWLNTGRPSYPRPRPSHRVDTYATDSRQTTLPTMHLSPWISLLLLLLKPEWRRRRDVRQPISSEWLFCNY